MQVQPPGRAQTYAHDKAPWEGAEASGRDTQTGRDGQQGGCWVGGYATFSWLRRRARTGGLPVDEFHGWGTGTKGQGTLRSGGERQEEQEEDGQSRRMGKRRW